MVGIKTIVLLILLFGFSACEYSSDGERPRKISYEASTTIKWINSNVSRHDEPASFGQEQYQIDENSNLLIKADDLSRDNYSWNVDDKFRMIFRVYLKNKELDLSSLEKVRLCPLLKDWMIYATWKKAHPFQGGDWSREGGDYSEDSCLYLSAYNSDTDLHAAPDDYVFPDPKSFAPDVGTRLDGLVQFDVTNWFLNGPYAGVLNKGFVLLSDEEQIVFAEHMSLQPSFVWSEPMY
jgi:hypothetical protein